MDSPHMDLVMIRRRKVNANTVEVAPEVQVEVYLSTIASVRAAVEAACLDEGTTFNSMGHYDYNAFYMPLMMVAGQMKAVIWAVDRWAFRAKYMKHIDHELSRIYRNKTLTDDIRFVKISHRLSRCKPYNTFYCQTFRNVIAHLNLLLEAGCALINFISLICREGNFLAFDRAQHLGACNHEIASSDGNFPTASSRNFQTEYSSFPNIECSVCTNQLTTPPHPATPAWKLSLAHKYAVEKLFVGPAELEVFAQTLSHAHVARMEIINTMNWVGNIADLADDMHDVFHEWNERCEMLEIECMAEPEDIIGEDASLGETEWERDMA